MNVSQEPKEASGIRFSIDDGGSEVARAYLYLMSNDLHDAPFGLLEDVHVDESQRGSGIGTQLVGKAIATAKDAGCYKLIATSRHARQKVHELYARLGFQDHGIEFRIDFR